MNNNKKIFLKYVTGYLSSTLLCNAINIYDINRIKSYKELINPNMVKEIEYLDYKELNIEQLEKDIRTNDDNKYLIEFQIKGSNKLNRLLFTEDYILNNPNYLDTEDLPIRDKNMLEAIKNGNIIVNKVWRKKREQVSYINIEEKFKEENLQHEFMITGKSPNPRHSTIKFIEDENGNIHTYYTYTKNKQNGNDSEVEFLGPTFDKVENLDEYTYNDYLMNLPVDYIKGIDLLDPPITYMKEIGNTNYTFEQLQKLNIKRAYIHEEKNVSVEELKKLLHSNDIYDFSFNINLKDSKINSYYYTITKREILKSDDLGIIDLIKEGKVESVNIWYEKGTSIIKNEMKEKLLYIFTENHLLVAEYSEEEKNYKVFIYEFEKDIDKVHDIKEDKLHYIKSIFK